MSASFFFCEVAGALVSVFPSRVSGLLHVGSDGLVKIVMKKLAPAMADKAMGKTMQGFRWKKRRPAKIRAAPSSSSCAKEPGFQRDASMVDLRCSGGRECNCF